MAEFTVSLSTLQSKADELEQLNQSFDAMKKSLDETEANLRSMWEGPAHDAFEQAYQHDSQCFTLFYNAIKQYIVALRQAIKRYAQAENRNTEIARTRTYG